MSPNPAGAGPSDPTGVEYLREVTALLQAHRLADPRGGIWEAADLQWWWTRDPHHDRGRARFWYAGATPVAAAILTDWSPRLAGLDVLGEQSRAEPWEWLARAAPPFAAEHERLDSPVPDGDVAWERRLAGLGFEAVDESYLSMWLSAADVADPPALPAGYRVVTRAQQPDGVHWLAGRNGDEVEERLRQCSLYDPRCDIAVIHDASDEVAAYSVYWPDPVTRVGLVEPVRVEDAHSGRGIGGLMLRHGLAALRDAGCTRLKVSTLEDNIAAARLYQGAGFEVAQRERTWRRSSASSP